MSTRRTRRHRRDRRVDADVPAPVPGAPAPALLYASTESPHTHVYLVFDQPVYPLPDADGAGTVSSDDVPCDSCVLFNATTLLAIWGTAPLVNAAIDKGEDSGGTFPGPIGTNGVPAEWPGGTILLEYV